MSRKPSNGRSAASKTHTLENKNKTRTKQRCSMNVPWSQEIRPSRHMREIINERKRTLQDEFKLTKEKSLSKHDYFQTSSKRIASTPTRPNPAVELKNEVKSNKMSIWILNEIPVNNTFSPNRPPDWIIKIKPIKQENSASQSPVTPATSSQSISLRPQKISNTPTIVLVSPEEQNDFTEVPPEVACHVELSDTLESATCETTPESSGIVLNDQTPTQQQLKRHLTSSQWRSTKNKTTASTGRKATCRKSLQKQFGNAPEEPSQSPSREHNEQANDNSECYLQEDPILEFEGYDHFYRKRMIHLQSAASRHRIPQETLSSCIYQVWLGMTQEERSCNVLSATMEAYLHGLEEDWQDAFNQFTDTDEEPSCLFEKNSNQRDLDRFLCKSPVTASEEKFLMDSLWPINTSSLAAFEDLEFESGFPSLSI